MVTRAFATGCAPVVDTIEPLEPRRLLAATVTFFAQWNLLEVDGSSGVDNIAVQMEVTNGQHVVSVSSDNQPVFQQGFATLQYIVVHGGDGNDSIAVTTNGHGSYDTYALVYGDGGADSINDVNNLDLGHVIDAGDANDSVTYSQNAEGTWGVIHLGNGNDSANVTVQGNLADGVIVHGDAGNDSITFTHNNTTADWMFGYGDAGDDNLTGADGANNLLDGGADNDNLTGGNNPQGAIDVLVGGDGNDSLVGNAGSDAFFANDNGGTDTLVSAGDNELDWLVFNANDSVNAGAEDQTWTV